MSTQLLTLILLLAATDAPLPSGSVSGTIALVSRGAARPDSSNVVVWLEGVHRPSDVAGAPHGQMKSDRKKFAPRVLVVPKRAKVEFPNADPIYHNVFSVSGANRFDLGLYRSGASRSKQFDDVGLVRVYCNIHPQMVGFVMVVDSDFAVATGRDGTFRFENVPAGAHTLKVWHEEAGAEKEVPLTVRPGANTADPISLDVSSYKVEPHKNKYGKEYPPQSAAEDERY
jgi:plastocyanin